MLSQKIYSFIPKDEEFPESKAEELASKASEFYDKVGSPYNSLHYSKGWFWHSHDADFATRVFALPLIMEWKVVGVDEDNIIVIPNLKLGNKPQLDEMRLAWLFAMNSVLFEMGYQAKVIRTNL